MVNLVYHYRFLSEYTGVGFEPTYQLSQLAYRGMIGATQYPMITENKKNGTAFEVQ